jgi:TPR repeat protein
MFEKGWGVSKDRREAIAWYRRAATTGDKPALEKLRELGEGTK